MGKNFDQGYETTEVVRDPDTGQIVRDRATGDPVTRKVLVVRDERAARDRTFTIAGETFTYRPSVRPEDTLRWSKLVNREYRVEEVLRDAAGTPILENGKPVLHIVKDITEEESLEIFDETILAFLDPLEAGQAEKWRRIRKDSANPLNLQDMTALIEWLFEEATGRPTSPPPASTNGSASGGTTSTEASQSPPAPAEASTT